MALNIPNVGSPGDSLLKGLMTGSRLYSNAMEPRLKREQLAQLHQHHLDQLELQRAAAARAAESSGREAELHPFRLQALQDAHLRASPDYKAQQWQSIMDRYRQMRGQSQGQGQATEADFLPSFMPSAGPVAPDFDTSGNFEVPEINKEAVNPYEASQPKIKTPVGEFDIEEIKKSPFLRGMFKDVFKIDPGKEASLTGPARDAQSMEWLKKNDPVAYHRAEEIQHVKEQQAKDLSEIRHRQLNGLKPGDVAIKDPKTGEDIGFRKQLDAKEREAARNTVLFNKLYPLVYKGGYILSGPGATEKMLQAARTYKTNPESRKLIDGLLIADKALGNTTVTEAARFGAGRTNQTYNRYQETLKTEDIHKKLKQLIKEHVIPAEANLKAGMTWQKKLNEAEKLANTRTPATRDYYFDTGRQFAEEDKRMAEGNTGSETEEPEITKIINGKTYKMINGEWHERKV